MFACVYNIILYINRGLLFSLSLSFFFCSFTLWLMRFTFGSCMSLCFSMTCMLLMFQRTAFFSKAGCMLCTVSYLFLSITPALHAIHWLVYLTQSFQSSVRRVALHTGKVRALIFGFSFIVWCFHNHFPWLFILNWNCWTYMPVLGES